MSRVTGPSTVSASLPARRPRPAGRLEPGRCLRISSKARSPGRSTSGRTKILCPRDEGRHEQGGLQRLGKEGGHQAGQCHPAAGATKRAEKRAVLIEELWAGIKRAGEEASSPAFLFAAP